MADTTVGIIISNIHIIDLILRLFQIMNKQSLCGSDPDEISEIIFPSGFMFSHAIAVSNNIYRKRIVDFSCMTGISKKLKSVLETNAIPGVYPPVDHVVSDDKTIKYLFRTDSGKEFETVFMPDAKRNTVCVSVQSGCRMGCVTCLTGRLGFMGNLSAGEIVNQIISLPDSGRITHVVFMGMGEPMDNIENVLKACKIITSEWGLALSPRNVTISTVGILPGIKKFLELTNCNLTVSMFSPFHNERQIMTPVEKIYPLANIIDLLKDTPVRKKRRLSIAYMMIKGKNDSDRHLEELKVLLKGSGLRVNLLPYHQSNVNDYHSSDPERMQFFKHNLVISGISASIRKSRGKDISAACGLLAAGRKGN
jgi:23S rRNA (adenine2503-C2)-methyltransferase